MCELKTPQEPKRSQDNEIADYLINTVGSVQNLKFNADTRSIYIWGVIDEDASGLFTSTFMTVDSTPGDINVILSSGGGSYEEGMCIFDVIQNANNIVNIDAYGACQSIAAIILQAATGKRRLSKNCDFMIHDGTIKFSEDVTNNRSSLTTLAHELTEGDDHLHKILSQRSGIPVSEIREYCKTDYHLKAVKAVKMGFADEVIKRATCI